MHKYMTADDTLAVIDNWLSRSEPSSTLTMNVVELGDLLQEIRKPILMLAAHLGEAEASRA